MYFYMKGLKSARFILWAAILVGSSMHITNSFAGTTVALRESYAGNLSFELAAGSFRNSASNVCNINSTASGTLSNIPPDAEIKAAYLYWAASYISATRKKRKNDTLFGQFVELMSAWDSIRDQDHVKSKLKTNKKTQ